ncbi:hypothetical protein FGB62_55g053 [Gracilaria domingensis]|nr:hypothetical protein FGB62_55g053 [Gracilaria domingensis]
MSNIYMNEQSIKGPSHAALQFHIASSCNESREASKARAGWVAILRTKTCAIEFHRPLCLKCDNGRQTSLRALLRCLSFVATTTHELTKVGPREQGNHGLSDARPLGGDRLSVKIFTPEKTRSLSRLGRGLYTAHQDLQQSIGNISKCLKQLGTSILIADESEEEEIMKYAIDLADYSCVEGSSAYCITCDYKCGGDFSPMIEHLKKVHMNRDPEEEAGRAIDFARKNAWSVCGICATAFLDTEELLEHQRKFH